MSRAAITELILETFRLNGRLLAAGDALVRDLGLTSARWQVLGAVAMSPVPLPVSHIARNMGLSRQGVAARRRRTRRARVRPLRAEPAPPAGQARPPDRTRARPLRGRRRAPEALGRRPRGRAALGGHRSRHRAAPRRAGPPR